MTPLSWTLMWKTKWEKRSTLPQPRISLIWLVYSAYTPWWTRNNTIRPNQKNGLTDQIPLLDGAVWTIFEQSSKFKFKSVKALGFICMYLLSMATKMLAIWKWKEKKPERVFGLQGLCRELDIFKIGNFLRNCFFGFFRDFFAEIFWIFLGYFFGRMEKEGRGGGTII